MSIRRANHLVLKCSADKQQMYGILYPTNHPTSTKGVVIIHGWMGSIPKHVRKYADLYTARDWAVVYGSSSLTTAAFRNTSKLDDAAIESVFKASEVLRKIEKAEGKKLPVILHYLSNGGAFVAESLAILTKEAKQRDEAEYSRSTLDPEVKQELLFISDRLYEKGYEVVDSAPAYLHESALFDAIDHAMPNPYEKIFTKLLLLVWNVLRDITRTIQRKDTIEVEFWRNMIESDLCLRQIYIYSVKDNITDSTKIDELIEERKKFKPDRNIISAKFEDSDHVMHLRRYPKEYMVIVDQVVNACS
mmetsp:Transcript_20778/g.31193  ORF Transcript_20778/g.31193 Transcript_20778/m.31193 type:complete len:304 (-) Transcript_20778:356-1267(-)